MKLKNLIKAGWPEKKDTCGCYKEDIGYNQAIAAIEPIKEMEVGVDKEKMQSIICDEWYRQLGTNINRGEACILFANALAANLDKFLVVEKK